MKARARKTEARFYTNHKAAGLLKEMYLTVERSRERASEFRICIRESIIWQSKTEGCRKIGRCLLLSFAENA